MVRAILSVAAHSPFTGRIRSLIDTINHPVPKAGCSQVFCPGNELVSFKSVGMHNIESSHPGPQELMAVFERRYLKENSTQFSSGQLVGGYFQEALLVSFRFT